jgi:hypothetical protein
VKVGSCRTEAILLALLPDDGRTDEFFSTAGPNPWQMFRLETGHCFTHAIVTTDPGRIIGRILSQRQFTELAAAVSEILEQNHKEYCVSR